MRFFINLATTAIGTMLGVLVALYANSHWQQTVILAAGGAAGFIIAITALYLRGKVRRWRERSFGYAYKRRGKSGRTRHYYRLNHYGQYGHGAYGSRRGA